MRIGEVARIVGVRPSAVRYYEERGLIEPDERRGGKRVYGREAVERMSLITFAKELGFSLDEIRTLLSGFPEGTRPNARWTHMAAAKLEELDAMTRKIAIMRAALERISRCECEDLDHCAKAIAEKRKR